MAYTEKSTYEYITGDELEDYHILTYVSVDARYTEAAVMAKVSHAERIIRSITNQTSSSDGIKSLVLEFSKYLMATQIVEDHPDTEIAPPDTKMMDQLFSLLVPGESYSPCGTVHGSGIAR